MIRISQIDSKLSIYKDKIVVLFGGGEGFKEILILFKHHKIDIEYICDNDKNKWGEIFEHIPIISPKHLEHIANNKLLSNKIVVQIVNKNAKKNVEEQFKSMGINQIISYNEAHKILNIISFVKLYKSDPQNPYFTYRNKQNNIDALKKMSVHNMLEKQEELPIFIVQIQKTGDMTLVETFKKII